MRVLAISSQVAYGPVGNSAAVPALEARGHEVLAVPTVVLSNHPGHGRPAGLRASAQDLAAMLAALERLGVLAGVAGVLTGYFVDGAQVEAVAAALARLKEERPQLFVLVDPVIGDDDGGLYVPPEVANGIREHLLPLASAIAPNRFELQWLSGQSVGERESAIAAARALGIGEVLATSIPAGDGMISSLLVTADGCESLTSPRLAMVPHGTGDYLSGAYLAARLEAPPAAAFHSAVAALDGVIHRSAGAAVLRVT